MSDKWQKFTETGRSFRASITISANGYLGFSEGACTRFHLKEHKAVILYFNEQDGMIGVEFVDSEDVEGARTLRLRERGADISAGPFLDRFDIRPRTTKKFDVTKDDETGFLVIDLSSGRMRQKKNAKSIVREA